MAMPVLRVEEQFELNAAADSFRSWSCCLLYMMSKGALDLLFTGLRSVRSEVVNNRVEVCT